MTDLIDENGRLIGVRAHSKTGALEIRADLVVGTDGRHSTMRARAGFEVMNLGAPMDVLWMRISRVPSDPGQTFGRVDAGRFMIHARARRLLAVRVCHPQGQLRGKCRKADSRLFKTSSRRWRRISAIASREISDWNQSACCQLRSIVCAGGSVRDCYASGTRRMRCHRSEGWESTSRFRMRSRPRIFSRSTLQRRPGRCRRAARGADSARVSHPHDARPAGLHPESIHQRLFCKALSVRRCRVF